MLACTAVETKSHMH